MAHSPQVIKFTSEVTLPIFTRINDEEFGLGEITVPIDTEINVTYVSSSKPSEDQ